MFRDDKMKYNNYEGWFKWVMLDVYKCQKCGNEVDEHQRMRHIGKHLRDGEPEGCEFRVYQKKKGE